MHRTGGRAGGGGSGAGGGASRATATRARRRQNTWRGWAAEEVEGCVVEMDGKLTRAGTGCQGGGSSGRVCEGSRQVAAGPGRRRE